MNQYLIHSVKYPTLKYLQYRYPWQDCRELIEKLIYQNLSLRLFSLRYPFVVKAVIGIFLNTIMTIYLLFTGKLFLQAHYNISVRLTK